MILLLAMLLTITPKECSSRPEWCYCRQYVEMEENRCELRVEEMIEDPWLQRLAIRRCQQEARKGARSCERNESDNTYQPVEVGEDE